MAAPGAVPPVDAAAAPEGVAAGTAPADWDRRGFVIAATAAAAASAGAGLLGRSLGAAGGRDAVASRARIRLPVPASKAAPVPAGARLRVPGVSSFVTPAADFYRVDTALVVPKVDARAWRLRIRGRGVRRPVTLSFDDLLRRELIERDITLTCVSNEVGGPYVGNARWTGVRLADLLAECGVEPPSRGGPADQLVARSVDGMTIGSPVEDVLDGRDAMLALGMNGRPAVRARLSGAHGGAGSVRLRVRLQVDQGHRAHHVRRLRRLLGEAGLGARGTGQDAVPHRHTEAVRQAGAGTVMVAGVAWAQHRGIDKVEVRVDDGPWRTADLAAEDTRDTWRQWSFPWRATKGGHTLTVRATDRTGAVQTEKRTRTVPDGASGRHSVVVTVD
ncbi:hypothetical protein SALBM135S_04262 [Streptomyces alboniger]